nr:diglucosylglycerate octanoyltransferase [Nocardia asiatica]
MSSEEPIRSVPDELFRKVSAKAERQLPDALFGGPPPASREPEATPEASSAAESGGPSEPAEESDAEDDGSAEVVAIAIGVQPQVHVGGDASPVGTANDAPGTIGESRAALGEQVAPDVDGAVAALGASVAPTADGSLQVLGGSAGSADESAADALRTSPEPTDPVIESARAESASPAAESVVGVEPSVAGGAELAPAESASSAADSVVDVEPSISGSAELARAESAPSAKVGIEDDDPAEPGEVAGIELPASAAESVARDEPAGEAVRPVLLVIADSLSYFGPKGGLPADHPRIWPNLVAAELDWDVELVARIGWTCRDAYWALIGDPRVWAAVPRAGAVVFAVGGMDTLPSPLPTALRELIRYVRPPALRRAVRATYNWLQPKLSKLGRPVALPPKVSVDYLEQSRTALTQLRPDLPFVAVLPSVHDCAAYGRVHSGRPRAVEALRAWSGRTSVPLVDLGEAVRENIFSGEANPDGIHWGWDGHTAVANAMVKTLQEVR